MLVNETPCPPEGGTQEVDFKILKETFFNNKVSDNIRDFKTPL